MNEFSNENYEELIFCLIDDSFYIESRPITGRISTIRRYTEIVIRKIFDIPETDKLMLGDSNITKMIKSKNNQLLTNAVENIRLLGNDNTHTQKTVMPTNEDLNKVLDSLSDLYSFLFIDYFNTYKFGTNDRVNSAFSILPPIIRYKTLSYLFEADKKNISLIDKLSLSILKAFSKTEALSWLDNNKAELEMLNVATEEADQDLINRVGLETAQNVFFQTRPENMFVMCYEKIESIAESIEQNGRLYNSFEEAKNLYRQKGIVPGNSNEINSFNSIMEFCYIGRKETKSNYDDISKYTIMNLRNADA